MVRMTDDFFNGEQLLNAPVPSTTAYGTIPTPVVSLTIQSALPGTMLADGEIIPSPGQSVIVKLYNDNTPYDASPIWARPMGRRAVSALLKTREPGSSSVWTTASILPAQPARRSWCILRAAYSGYPGKSDDRPAARAGDHHLASR